MDDTWFVGGQGEGEGEGEAAPKARTEPGWWARGMAVAVRDPPHVLPRRVPTKGLCQRQHQHTLDAASGSLLTSKS